MAPKNNKRKSSYARKCLQSSGSNESNDPVSPPISAQQKKAFLQPYVDQLVQLKITNNHRLPRQSYQDMIKNLKEVGINWVTIDSLKSKVKRATDTIVHSNKSTECPVLNTTPPPPGVNPSDTSRSIQTVRKRGGRPKGTTTEFKSLVTKCSKEAKDEITELYHSEYIKAKSVETDRVRLHSINERVSKGTFDKIFDSVKLSRNLPDDFKYSYNACKQRITRGMFSSPTTGNLSPLNDIEDHIITLLLALADSGNPISVGNALPLINSLIHGTPHQQKVILWKKHHLLHYDKEGQEIADEELGQVGVGYWRLFLKRHKDKLTTNKGRLFELNRTNWTLYRNFRDMYIDVERHMVDAKVAETLNEPSWMDKDGNIVSECESYGMKVSTKLTHPHCCLAMDETGGDTSMMKDGAAGGEKYIGRKGQAVKRPAGKKAKKYTTIGLTGLDGNAAMCIVIFSGVERNLLMESGVDTSLFGDGKDLDLDSVQDNLEFFRKNYGEGKIFPGGPTCEYNGKVIPCMIRYSPGGGITPQILTDILKTIDSLGVFDKEREEGIRPFLLLDGHQSRFSIPFLEYITDPAHPWKVCIGVPYGTALWQIGDSVHQNGRYKIRTTDRKRNLLRRRISQMVAEIEILPSDIIPIINDAWNHSFADTRGNQQAIVQRGWFPLNRNLLLLPELRKTMTCDDHDWESRSLLYPEVRIENERKKKEQHPSLPTMRNNASIGGTSIEPPNLNTTQGVSGSAIQFLIGQEEQQSIRAESAKKRKTGNTVREGFKRLKSLKASGQMIAYTGTFEVGLNTLDEVNRRVAVQQSIKEEEDRKKQDTHMKHISLLNELREEKPIEASWTKPQILTALRAAKKPGDRANPKNRDELMSFWKELRSRVLPPVVEEESQGNNGIGSQVLLANDTSVPLVPVQVSQESFNGKEGANEQGAMAI